MMEELESILIRMNNHIMKIEDSIPDELSRLEAKKIYIIGVLNQLELEFRTLQREYDNAGYSYFDEEETLQMFEDSREAYKDIIDDLFKH
jgi:hypothetical protein